MYYLGVDPLLPMLLDIELLLFLHSPERSYLLCWALCAIPCDQMGQRIDVSTIIRPALAPGTKTCTLLSTAIMALSRKDTRICDP